ncbi:MAG: hypothetical protein HYT36_02570 [Candidatus Staskawiczbacteria bacterium]|nr:hypothetical protein [Candidatus Staskawiczbacteria bacterium]
MILTPHLVFGAAVGSLAKNPFLAVALAFLSHYVLDMIPHADYSINNIRAKQWQKIMPDCLKVFADFSLGITLIFIFSGNQPIVYISAFFSILSDGFDLLSLFFKAGILTWHGKIHKEKVHSLSSENMAKIGKSNIKISLFWRILSQIAIIVISVAIMATPA